MTISAHPLTWPEGWKRTPDVLRGHGHFGKRVSRQGVSWKPLEDLTVHEAVRRVLGELQRMGIGRDDVVISTNVPVRMDGLPRSDAKRPADPGAAVYWEELTGERRCIAVDQYFKVEDNLAAIAATLEALRAIERHGGAAILDRAFTGFTALPAPGAKRSWREVLGFERLDGIKLSPELIRERYRSRASSAHPDKGGSHAEMSELNAARDEALRECGR